MVFAVFADGDQMVPDVEQHIDAAVARVAAHGATSECEVEGHSAEESQIEPRTRELRTVEAVTPPWRRLEQTVQVGRIQHIVRIEQDRELAGAQRHRVVLVPQRTPIALVAVDTHLRAQLRQDRAEPSVLGRLRRIVTHHDLADARVRRDPAHRLERQCRTVVHGEGEGDPCRWGRPCSAGGRPPRRRAVTTRHSRRWIQWASW